MTIREIYEQHVRGLSPEERLELVALIAQEMAHPSRPSSTAATDLERPMSELEKELRELRARIVASGEPLLDADEVLREVAERRGGLEVLEADERADLR
jgi:hypothetical protein